MSISPGPIYDNPMLREELFGRKSYPRVVIGTTNATANNQSLFPHGVTTADGNLVAANRIYACLVATTAAGAPALYINAITQTQLDVRATAASIPFVAFVFLF